MHNKFAMIDGRVLINGSFKWVYRSTIIRKSRQPYITSSMLLLLLLYHHQIPTKLAMLSFFPEMLMKSDCPSLPYLQLDAASSARVSICVCVCVCICMHFGCWCSRSHAHVIFAKKCTYFFSFEQVCWYLKLHFCLNNQIGAFNMPQNRWFISWSAFLMLTIDPCFCFTCNTPGTTLACNTWQVLFFCSRLILASVLLVTLQEQRERGDSREPIVASIVWCLLWEALEGI